MVIMRVPLVESLCQMMMGRIPSLEYVLSGVYRFLCPRLVASGNKCRCFLSYPSSKKQNQSRHTCAQDVQMAHTTNNMVNIYNISLNYKLRSLKNDPWVQKKDYRVAWKSKRR
jgi:hypothetical protein